MYSYKLRTDTRPTLWNVAPPLSGLALFALLLWAAPHPWRWWGALGVAVVLGVVLYLLGMARNVAVLEERGGFFSDREG